MQNAKNTQNVGNLEEKILKKIKFVWYCFVFIVLILGIVAALQIIEDRKEHAKQDKIQDLINEELYVNVETETDLEDSTEFNIEDIVSGGIDVALKEPMFKNITMIDSSTFEAEVNNENFTYHLIGVAGDGNKEAVKSILEGLVGGIITYDTMKNRNGIKQIYLWNGETSDIGNMINLQIVRLNLCSTTYTGTSYAEAPNITYSSKFVDAAK